MKEAIRITIFAIAVILIYIAIMSVLEEVLTEHLYDIVRSFDRKGMA